MDEAGKAIAANLGRHDRPCLDLAGSVRRLMRIAGAIGVSMLFACEGGSAGLGPSTSAVDGSCPRSSGNASIAAGISAPYGVVKCVDSATGTFVMTDTSGVDLTVNTVSGTTYQYTVATSDSQARVGGYVAGQGTVTDGRLVAVDLAFVPAPPNFIASWDTASAPQGTVWFGRMTAVQDSLLTISVNGGSRTIEANGAAEMTLTTASGFQGIQVGKMVEINGPRDSTFLFTGHQVNIGMTPAVVGQFD
jgi:hypothetical protein